MEIASKYEIAAANLAIALQTDTVSVEQRSELRAAIGSSIDKLISDTGTGINHQYIPARKLLIGSYHRRHTIIPQRPGSFIEVFYRKRSLFIEPQNGDSHIFQLRQHLSTQINDSSHYRFFNRICTAYFRQPFQRQIGVIHHLHDTSTIKHRHLGDCISYINNEIHRIA